MQKGIGSKPMPAAMRSMLEQNVFIFSGFKTHAELSAVSALLLDESGKKKPFERFARDVQAIDENYNLNYLRAEYNFATQSARSAAMWAQYQADADQFYLQYRTAADERVRESHALLHGTTLPVNDPFWQKFFPPNGWNCRCTVVQVRKSKYPVSDSKHAIELGEKATTALNKHGQNKLAIFRFNPGQEQKIFPPRHPYLPKGCGNCNKNQLDYKPNNPMCQACVALKDIETNKINSNRILFDRLKSSSEYVNLDFDEKTGAIMAEHIGHKHDPKTFIYEERCQKIIFKSGRSSILRDESIKDSSGDDLPSIDMDTLDFIMDIRTITKKDTNTIRNGLNEKHEQIKNVYKKTGVVCETVCLYFDDPSLFDETTVKDGTQKYIRLKNGKHRIKKIICAINDGENTVVEYNI